MILQALYEYYQRKAVNPESKMAPSGLEWKEIPFLIVINKNGEFINLEDTRQEKGKKKQAQSFLVVKDRKQSSKKITNVFWDRLDYVLRQTENPIEIEKIQERHSIFLSVIVDYAEKFSNNKEIQAVKFFYDAFDENVKRIHNHPLWGECYKMPGGTISFRLSGYNNIIAENKDIAVSDILESEEKPQNAICLITGKKGPVARLHTKSRIPGGQKTALVSFQKDSGYDSYCKSQGMNAPVSLEAEAAYTTALNHLLSKNSENKYLIHNTTYLFWATRANILEKNFSFLFSAPPKDDPDHNTQEVKSLWNAVQTGVLNTNDKDMFYILGLSPNSGRISVRFWKVATTKEIGRNIAKHFQDLKIIGSLKDLDGIPLDQLINSVFILSKDKKGNNEDKMKAKITAAVMSSVLNSTMYPETLFQYCLRRVRAEYAREHQLCKEHGIMTIQERNCIRASILKAYLNRKTRIRNYNHEEEVTVALDKNNANVGYLCGRLFAVLEQIQKKAQPDIKTGINKSYYGAASSTPVTVFGRLIALANYHLSKLKEEGLKIYWEQLVLEIIAEIPSSGFPKHLSLDDQARFAIGYYHQRQDLYTPRNEKQEEKNDEN